MYNKFDNLNFDLTKLKKKIENEKLRKIIYSKYI